MGTGFKGGKCMSTSFVCMIKFSPPQFKKPVLVQLGRRRAIFPGHAWVKI